MTSPRPPKSSIPPLPPQALPPMARMATRKAMRAAVLT
jgi:hypothetical protein